jgi:hypothetical protein
MVLVGTASGCRVFCTKGERATEIRGRQFTAMALEAEGTCLAVIEGHEIWRRDPGGAWSKIATSPIALQSLISSGGLIFGGGMDEAIMIRITEDGKTENLAGFDICEGREDWFAGGPPLGVRSLTATVDGVAIIAAVHVGGLPRSVDGAETWNPTIPIMFDVHEVRAHPTLPNVVAAAAAVGLCVSSDGGQTYEVISEGLTLKNSLALAVRPDEVIFGICDGPFAKQSQIWRWQIGATSIEHVRDGLPEWLDGKVDTAQIAASGNRAAIIDGAGNLWLSESGSKGWKSIASGLPYPSGVVLLPDPREVDP